MKTSYNDSSGDTLSELAIVDTFTKLIFGEDKRYSDAELRIIQALRLTDGNISLDGHHDLGVYLRALGVEEMIRLVSRVQGQMASGHNLPPRRRGSDGLHPQRSGI
ncbi:MAG: hypothetical protein ACI8QT_001280 [Halioglobus sp.]|jgi:hypothetical protein